MTAPRFLVDQTPTERSKHLPHLLIPLLKYGHGVPAITAVPVILLLVGYAFFKLAQIRSA
jgi:hypothetical protein